MYDHGFVARGSSDVYVIRHQRAVADCHTGFSKTKREIEEQKVSKRLWRVAVASGG